MSDFTRTGQALRVYDAHRIVRNALWEAAVETFDVYVAEQADKEAAELVHQAFFEDTKEFNSIERCRLVHPDDPWLRNTIKNVEEIMEDACKG